jgi:hypothetical protein
MFLSSYTGLFTQNETVNNATMSYTSQNQCINHVVTKLVDQKASIETFVKELNSFTKAHPEYTDIQKLTQTLLNMDRNNKIMLFYTLLQLKNMLMEKINAQTQALLAQFIKTISTQKV